MFIQLLKLVPLHKLETAAKFGIKRKSVNMRYLDKTASLAKMFIWMQEYKLETASKYKITSMYTMELPLKMTFF